MASQLNDLYNQLDDLQELWGDGDAAPAQTEIFLTSIKNATDTAQRGIVAELGEVVSGILQQGNVDTYNAFINTLFDVAGYENMTLGQPILRADTGHSEYQEACQIGNLALVTLSEISQKVNPHKAVELQTRIILAIHPDQDEDKVRKKLEDRYKHKMG